MRKDGKGIISLTLITSTFACPSKNSGYIEKDDEECFSATNILSIAVVIRPVFAVVVIFQAVVRLFRKK